MIYQIAPIVTTAILQSLIAGGICYTVLSVLLIVMKKSDAAIKYHLGNIALLVSFICFIQPLYTIPEVIEAAPIHSTTTVPVAYEKTNNVAPYVIQETAALPEPKLTPGQVWQHVNDTITANSDMIMLLYLAGLLFFSTRLLLQYLQSRGLKTRGTQPANDVWTKLLAKTKEQLNISADIAITFTEKKISPCIIGHAKAVILIPIAIANNLSTEQAESILLHELAHYKQYDYYINLITQCINCILFFNPFVWLITKQCDKYRELSCDATATRHDRSIELAETLAMIAGMHTVENRLSLNLKKRSPLLSRIQILLNIQPSPKTSPRLLSFALVSIMLVTGLILASSTTLFSSEKDKQKEELRQISKEMYEAGNEKYIFVDAVMDSIITLPSYAEVLYMGPQYMGFETSQGMMELYGAQKEKYVEKLQRFLMAQGENKYTPVNLKIWRDKEIVIPEDIYSDKFRTVSRKDRYQAGIKSRAWSIVFNAMMADSLPRNINDDYEVAFGPRGIVVNGDSLRGAKDIKYRRLFSEVLGIDLDKDMLSGRMNMKSLMEQQIAIGDDFSFGDVPNTAELTVIGQKLFNEGQIEYLLVDALKDGYIKDAAPFTIHFADSSFRIEGETFNKARQKEYDAKYKQFRQYYVCRDCYGSVTKKLSYADIMNPHSDFRKGEFLFKERQETRSKKLANIYKELQKDGLIDTNYRTDVNYQGKDFYLNTFKIDAKYADKYNRLFRDAYPSHGKSYNEHFGITWNDSKPFAMMATGEMGELVKLDILELLSENMFTDGQTSYIIVDALIDGLLKEGERYHVTYKDDVVTISDKTLTTEQQRAYNKKYSLFIRKHHPENNFHGSLRGTVKTEDILNQQSVFKKDMSGTFVPGSTQTYTDYIINEMHNDGLVDTNFEVRIECSPLGVFANDMKLEGAMKEKYLALFQQSDPTLGVTKKTSMVKQAAKQHNGGKMQARHKDALQRLSDTMFANGSQSFAILDAIRDGYIKQDQPYEISYREGKFSVKGQNIPADIRARYERKLERFRAFYGDSVNMWGTISSTLKGTVWDNEFEKQFGIMMPKHSKAEKEKEEQDKQKVTTSHISIGATTQFIINNANLSQKEINKIVQTLKSDKLVDTGSYYKLEYMTDGVYLNATQLTDNLGNRYIGLLNSMGFKPGKGLILEHIPWGVGVADTKYGKTTTHLETYGTNLPAIAQKMFADGNPDFILAYALNEGLIKEGKHYNFMYNRGIIAFDGKILPEPIQSKYAKRMKDFYKAHKSTPDSYSSRGGGITIKELNNPESTIRKHRVVSNRYIDEMYYTDYVVKQMAKDGLIDTNKKHTMKYNARGIFVNGRKLTEEEAAKYEPVLEAGFGHKPKWIAGDEVSYSNEP